MYVNCQGALAIEIWPGIFILKNLKVHQNQKNGVKRPNGYILSAYLKNTTFGLKTLYFKPFDGYPYFTLDINTTVSTCPVRGNISTGVAFRAL